MAERVVCVAENFLILVNIAKGYSMQTELLAAELKDVSVGFHQEEILHSVSLAIPQSGVTVLVGRSGSGKTTLLRCFNRLNECFTGCTNSGDVHVRLRDSHGKDMVLQNVMDRKFGEPYELRAQVGMVFQHPDVLPVSIFRNLELPLRHVLGLDKDAIARRIEHALRRVSLWDDVQGRLHSPAESLSGGQQQRLCLARALALDAVMLLLDEPTASLDTVSTRLIESLIQKLGQEYPIVMVSHSLSQALRLADHLVFMHQGRIVNIWHKKSASYDTASDDMESAKLQTRWPDLYLLEDMLENGNVLR